MRPTHPRYLPALVGLALLMLATAVSANFAGPGSFDLSWFTIDGGGGKSLGGTFELEGTIGQPDAGGPMTGGTFSLTGGFWPGAGPSPTPCPADIALPHNSAVDTDDLLAMLGGWGLCPGPCPPNCVADIALPKNCAVDTDDLLLLLGSWGPCPAP